MILTDNRKATWFFYPAWVAAGAISIPIAWYVTWAIISQIVSIVGGSIVVEGESRITEDLIGVYVLVPALGLVMGVLQYFLLGRYLPRMGWWIGATVLGWVLPMALLRLATFGSIPGLGIDPMWRGAVGFGILGASLGLCQWLVLRRRIPRAAWWILAGVVGWGMAGVFSGESISSQLDVIAVALLPPTAASIAWWLLLEKLPARSLRSTN